MATNKRHGLFEELGFLDEPEPVNPLDTLGLSQDFANELLTEDPTGQVLRDAASALYRVLSRRYHPDIRKTGDRDRFEALNDADRRLADATAGALSLWAKPERQFASSAKLKKVEAEHVSAMARAAGIVTSSLEHGSDPLHFSRLETSQGVLLEHSGSNLLLRQGLTSGLEVTKGRIMNLDKMKLSPDETQAFDFRVFLAENKSFDLDPGMKVAAYVDEGGRASILSDDLEFIMDVTDPVAKYKAKHARANRAKKSDGSTSDVWVRSNDPVLFVTSVPLPTDQERPAAQVVTFPNVYRSGGVRRDLQWNVPLELAGSLDDDDFFNKIRYAKTTKAMAITAMNDMKVMSQFNLLSTQVATLIDQDPGYTPLLKKGNTMLLYDTANHTPVVTDAHVVGMIGSNSRAG